MGISDIQKIDDYYKKQIAGLHKFRNLLVTYVDLPIEENSEKHDQISDFILFTTLLNLDIAICCKHLLINRVLGDEWEMNYFSRALAIHCSDALEKRKENGGSRFLNKLENIIDLYIIDADSSIKELAIRLESHRLKIVSIHELYTTDLKYIRNNLFAHRDKTGIEQNNAIDKISPKDIGFIGEDIYEILYEAIGDVLKIQEIIAPFN
ncbi:MAG: hypothetical protein P4L41_13450 [Flavipsychrobacter sp.]|nr:hypothetical protein [Flavipsychrobacter sp.]